jgi:hypothetical protein
MDALAVTGVVAAIESNGDATGGIAGFSTAVYALDGTVVHALHGHPTRAAASLGVRIGAPLVFALAGAVAANRPQAPSPPTAPGVLDNEPLRPNPAFGAAILGAGLGALTAVVVDDLVLAWERPRPSEPGPASDPDQPSDEPRPRDPQQWSFAVTPRAAVVSGDASHRAWLMGIAGTF